MNIGAWQIVIVLGIIGFIIFRNIKNRPEQKLDKRTQGFLKDLEKEAKTETRFKKKSKTINNENTDEGLMNKVKRLKSLYNNGTLTKAEFEKAKNKLLK